MVLAMAQACQDGGAAAVRIEGSARVATVARQLQVPVIGIVKREWPASAVRITPLLEDVRALAVAGARVIAVDATDRPRPVAVSDLLHAIHRAGCLAMADCATVEQGLAAWRLGFDVVGSTLSGYTTETACAPDAPPDLDMVQALSDAGVWVMAEGRINSPQLAAEALARGAYAVTVGSALTRLEIMVAGYVQAMAHTFAGRAT